MRSLGSLGLLFLAACGAYGQSSAQTQRALLDKYCVTCHNEKLKTASLELDKADIAHPADHPEIWEKVLWKLTVGSMPPSGLPRPEKGAVDGLSSYLSIALDAAYAAHINPGRPLIHRLNRAEYQNAVRDLLNVEVDADDLLPADSASFGFDNNADSLTMSPLLLEKYLSAASKISVTAVGNPKAKAVSNVYRIKFDHSQNERVEGLPFGTRGGTAVRFNFPADGEYLLRGQLFRPINSSPRGVEGKDKPEEFEILVDGTRVLKSTFGGKGIDQASYENYTLVAEEIASRMQTRAPIKAGPHTIGFTFADKGSAASQEIYEPELRTSLEGQEGGGLPQLESVTITGPFRPTGVSDTPSRHTIFVCRPKSTADEVPCAKKIISTLARHAYRRPVNDGDVETLLTFYQRGRNRGAFDDGIRLMLTRLLTSPSFLFREEVDPANIPPSGVYRVSDIELASRLSFFLWSSIPDDELLNLASENKLHEPAILQEQVERMLSDKRAHELAINFAGQWLGLRGVPKLTPDPLMFSNFDDILRQSFRTETEMFVESVMREDRNILDLLNADYTFVNERLAKHYGIPGVYGEEFRRVAVTDENRRGLLGQASILTMTSTQIRTSPVKRGKWILTNLLDSPPPPPPPNVPVLTENKAGSAPQSVRERLEQHRANPVCASCHKNIDPIGFSMENFDAIGEWRDKVESGAPVDASGQLADGTKIDSPAALRRALLARPNIFIGTFTERLLTYALGRGIEPYEMAVVRQIDRNAARNDYRFSSIVMGIVSSPPFQMRTRNEDKATESVGLPVTKSPMEKPEDPTATKRGE